MLFCQVSLMIFDAAFAARRHRRYQAVIRAERDEDRKKTNIVFWDTMLFCRSVPTELVRVSELWRELPRDVWWGTTVEFVARSPVCTTREYYCARSAASISALELLRQDWSEIKPAASAPSSGDLPDIYGVRSLTRSTCASLVWCRDKPERTFRVRPG